MKLKVILSVFLIITLLTSCKTKSSIKKRPNILFVISDDQSYQHTSFAGSSYINTPAFDKIAREGIYFENCYAGSPGCAPSRSSIVTGRHHWQNEQSGQHASSWLKKYVSFVDELEANGYVIGKTGKGVEPFQYAINKQDTLRRKINAAGPAYDNIKYDENNDERFASEIGNINYAENFKNFIENTKSDSPFFFWFGAQEPHRAYEKGSWKRRGKKIESVEVPEFLPDNEEIRGDLLDYAIEIEWFDLHLQKIITYLDEIGELDNTIIIVTSDNGMPFPRAKANSYEYGVHVPLAIRYPKIIQAGRRSKTPVGFIDIAPTILELTNTTPKDMMPITGKSISTILNSTEENYDREVYSGRERHSSSRYLNKGYPQRSLRKGDYLYIWNPAPKRWPAGAPQKYDAIDSTKLLPMYGLNKKGEYINGDIFADIDESPSKQNLIENYKTEVGKKYFDWAIDKRPEFELYNITTDKACLNNLAGLDELSPIEKNMKTILMNELKRTNDPRVDKLNFNVFDTYKRYMHIRKFPEPNKYKN